MLIAYFVLVPLLFMPQVAPPHVVTDSSLVGGAVVHDLAVVDLIVPTTVALDSSGAAVTQIVQVQIQNRCAHDETIPDLETLEKLVHVELTSLGSNCVAPQAILIQGEPNVVPKLVKSKRKFYVAFQVIFDCANDALAGAGHEDFLYTATVSHSAIDGVADAHPFDDVAPRPALPTPFDRNPDFTIKDEGVGGTFPDGTLGAPVVTDVVGPASGNHAPDAMDDVASTIIDEPLAVPVLANDTDIDGDALSVKSIVQPQHGLVTLAGNVTTFTPEGGFSGKTSFGYIVTDGKADAFATVTMHVLEVPADPAANAPPPENGVVTLLADSTAFLYSGPNPVQFDVAPGTIQPIQAAVVRGLVRGRDSAPISGVRISVLDGDQYGYTLTRTDGRFDLAVNGGGLITLRYEQVGYCPIQRQVEVPWQDYVSVDDVVLSQLDSAMTTIALGPSAPAQIHQGTPQTDAEGTRQATLLIPPAMGAMLVSATGEVQPVDTLHVRATEFTVGPDGPAAMPGELPPASAYTYCVDFSADEVAADPTVSVQFTAPIVSYVENFLEFPVGAWVPVGYYDLATGQWVAAPNGRVIGIVGISGGMADVDTNGDGSTDNSGLTGDERMQLASLYAAGQSLWRCPITHFTPYDFNYPWGLPEDAITPAKNGANVHKRNESQSDPTNCGGCAIEAENRVLRESLAVVGTPYTLNYRSDRVPGHRSVLDVDLGGPEMPSSLQSIELHASVGGVATTQSFSAAPDQHTTITSEGLNPYGAPTQGAQLVTGSIDYLYSPIYLPPAAVWGFGLNPIAVLGYGQAPNVVPVKMQIAGVLGEGHTDARAISMGGWTLSGHHFYDPIAKVLETGGGRRVRSQQLCPTITTIAGKSSCSTASTLPVPALEACLVGITDVEAAPDGGYYIATNARIYRVDPQGTLSVIAGNGQIGWTGDNGPATQAKINARRLALGADGSLYFSDSTSRVRRVDPDGIITTVAGDGQFKVGGAGDGGPALAASFVSPSGIEVAPDGSLYVADFSDNRVRRIGPEGIITTVAGGAATFSSGDGGLATQAGFTFADSVAVAADGSLYIADMGFAAMHGHRIRRVGPDGIISTVAGTGTYGFGVDGIPATSSALTLPTHIAVGADGSLYFVDSGRIRRVTGDGIITTVAGTLTSGTQADGVPATQTSSIWDGGIALAPDGSILVGTTKQVRRISNPLPGFEDEAFRMASEDASELYTFDKSGRHLNTLNALTDAVVREFSYDDAGRLEAVYEKTGGIDNITTIQHDADGNPIAIVGPYGQVTMLAVDANGFLASIVNPANEATSFTSTPDGLLLTLTDANGHTYSNVYDADGALEFHADAGGGTQQFTVVQSGNPEKVERTTALGRTMSFETEMLPGNVRQRKTTQPDGTSEKSIDAFAMATNQELAADGSNFQATLAPDPRFGMSAPYVASGSVLLPSSLNIASARTRTAVLDTSTSPPGLTSLTETVTTNEHTSSSTYTSASKSIVHASPEGRSTTIIQDDLGRLVALHPPGPESISCTYDAHGRITSLAQGTGATARSHSFTYDSRGFLETITDPVGRTTTYGRDEAGRNTSVVLPNGETVALAYDAVGNMISVTTPKGTSHMFGYSSRNELLSVTPPAVPGTGTCSFEYDLDGLMTTATRPGGEALIMAYDVAGRPLSRILVSNGVREGVLSFAYDTAGRLASTSTSSGIDLAFAYDGQIVTGETLSGLIAGSFTKAYDAELRLISESVNGSNAITFGYDQDGLLTSAGSMAITHDPVSGLATNSTLGIVTTTLAHNTFGELIGNVVSVRGTPTYDVAYERDSLGRITRKIELIEGATDVYVYGYDLLGRLTSVEKNSIVVESYAWDGNGNCVSSTIAGITQAGTYDAQDRLTQDGTTTITYNAAGDLASKTGGSGTTLYDFDTVGNLLGVQLPNGTTIDYLVDGRDRRVGKRVDGVLVQGFLYRDGRRPIAELDGSGSVVSRFVYSGLLAPAYVVKGGATYRVIADTAGSVRLVIDSATGATAQRLDYDAFGNVMLDTNPGFQPFGFGGGLYDPDTGLVCLGARDYDPASARWTVKDPIGFGANDFNLYRYCSNDPINGKDPNGLDGGYSVPPWLGDGQYSDGEVSNVVVVSAPLELPGVCSGDLVDPWDGCFEDEMSYVEEMEPELTELSRWPLRAGPEMRRIPHPQTGQFVDIDQGQTCVDGYAEFGRGVKVTGCREVKEIRHVPVPSSRFTGRTWAWFSKLVGDDAHYEHNGEMAAAGPRG